MTININNLTVAYDDFGVGETPIIFLHGFPFDKSTWKPQMDFFKQTHRVIAYDIRGFGKSDAGSIEPTIQLFADDLIALMDALKIEKAIVCGLSMGGYILLDAVQRYQNRFAALILSDTQCVKDSDEAYQKRQQTIAQINEMGLAAFTDGFIKNIFCELSLTTKKTLVNTVKNTMLSTQIPTVVQTLMALANRKDTCDLLHEITIPTLILCGKEDMVTPLVQSTFLQNKIPNATLKIIENAGHLSNLEQPEVWNTDLIDWTRLNGFTF
jgi:3-oxoadipate enol-lactonase